MLIHFIFRRLPRLRNPGNFFRPILFTFTSAFHFHPGENAFKVMSARIRSPIFLLVTRRSILRTGERPFLSHTLISKGCSPFTLKEGSSLSVFSDRGDFFLMWWVYGYWPSRRKSGFLDLSTTVASITNAPLRSTRGIH